MLSLAEVNDRVARHEVATAESTAALAKSATVVESDIDTLRYDIDASLEERRAECTSLAKQLESTEHKLAQQLAKHSEEHASSLASMDASVASLDAQRAADLDLINAAMETLQSDSTALSNTLTARQNREIEKSLAAATHRELHTAFSQWVGHAKHVKRIENLARRGLHRAAHGGDRHVRRLARLRLVAALHDPLRALRRLLGQDRPAL